MGGFHHKYHCPSVSILHWESPVELPSDVADYLRALDPTFPAEELTDFLYLLEDFVLNYWKDIPPYDSEDPLHLLPRAPALNYLGIVPLVPTELQ